MNLIEYFTYNSLKRSVLLDVAAFNYYLVRQVKELEFNLEDRLSLTISSLTQTLRGRDAF